MEYLIIDMRTVILLLAVGNLLAAGLLAVYRAQEDLPVVYLAARLIQACAWFLLWRLGALPFWLSYVVGSVMLSLGWAMEAFAMLSIDRNDRRVKLFYLALGAMAIAVPPLSYWLELPPAEAGTSASVLALLIFVPPAFTLSFDADASPFRRAFGALYMVFCAVLLHHALQAVSPVGPGAASTPWVAHAMGFIAAYALLVFGNIGYVLLLKEKLDRELRRAATTDGLTGILNRAAFIASTAGIMQLATRRHEPVTLLLIDLDRFKRINDTYGHPVGDIVLKGFAAGTRQLVRPYDVFGRVGGEEFAIAHLGTAEDSRQVAERIRAACENQTFAEAPEVRYTVSIGGYTTVPHSSADFDTMMRHCDAALYQAKNAGRSRVVMIEAAPDATWSPTIWGGAIERRKRSAAEPGKAGTDSD